MRVDWYAVKMRCGWLLVRSFFLRLDILALYFPSLALFEFRALGPRFSFVSLLLFPSLSFFSLENLSPHNPPPPPLLFCVIYSLVGLFHNDADMASLSCNRSIFVKTVSLLLSWSYRRLRVTLDVSRVLTGSPCSQRSDLSMYNPTYSQSYCSFVLGFSLSLILCRRMKSRAASILDLSSGSRFVYTCMLGAFANEVNFGRYLRAGPRALCEAKWKRKKRVFDRQGQERDARVRVLGDMSFTNKAF